MAGKVTDFNIAEVIKTLKKVTKEFRTPGLMLIKKHNDPFMVLISCIISLRTRDDVMETASARIFALAKTSAELVRITNAKLEKAIYPAAFYRNKAKSIKEAQEEIKEIIQGLENNDVNIHDSLEQYKRMMQLNYHIQEEFKKKAKKINKTSLEKNKHDGLK